MLLWNERGISMKKIISLTLVLLLILAGCNQADTNIVDTDTNVAEETEDANLPEVINNMVNLIDDDGIIFVESSDIVAFGRRVESTRELKDDLINIIKETEFTETSVNFTTAYESVSITTSNPDIYGYFVVYNEGDHSTVWVQIDEENLQFTADSSFYDKVNQLMNNHIIDIAYAIEGDYAMLNSSLVEEEETYYDIQKVLDFSDYIIIFKEFWSDSLSCSFEVFNKADGESVYLETLENTAFTIEKADWQNSDFRIKFADGSIVYRSLENPSENVATYNMPAEFHESMKQSINSEYNFIPIYNMYDALPERNMAVWSDPEGIIFYRDNEKHLVITTENLPPTGDQPDAIDAFYINPRFNHAAEGEIISAEMCEPQRQSTMAGLTLYNSYTGITTNFVDIFDALVSETLYYDREIIVVTIANSVAINLESLKTTTTEFPLSEDGFPIGPYPYISKDKALYQNRTYSENGEVITEVSTSFGGKPLITFTGYEGVYIKGDGNSGVAVCDNSISAIMLLFEVD